MSDWYCLMQYHNEPDGLNQFYYIAKKARNQPLPVGYYSINMTKESSPELLYALQE